MRFALSDAERQGADAVRRIVAAYAGSGGSAPAGSAALPRPALSVLFAQLAATGYLGSTLPPALGGSGLSPLAFAVLVESLAPELTLLGNHSVQRYLSEFGNPEQQRSFLPALLDGSGIGAIAITEPHAGSDLAALGTRATRAGANYRLNGSKTWVTHGMTASVFIVLAITEDEGGLTRFIVPAETHGLSKRPLQPIGLKHLTFAEVTFDDCEVPAQQVLGGVGQGAAGSKSAFPIARALAALQALRIAGAALDAAADYAKGRSILGTPLARREVVQDGYVRLATQVDALRLFTYRALGDFGRPETARDTSAAKAAAADVALQACAWAADVVGSQGLASDHPITHLALDARMMSVVDGTSVLNRLVAARRHLGGS